MAVEWRAEGILLSVMGYGEADAVVDLFTRAHGRVRGFVRGGSGRRQKPLLQPGNRLAATWRARLADSLGSYQLEPAASPLGDILASALRLAALNALTAILAASLPEREAYPDVFDTAEGLLTVIRMGDAAQMAGAFVRLELGILSALGYGLDLSSCAVTGEATGLAFVSPKTGRAVSAAGAGPYKARLLALPEFVLAGGAMTLEDGLKGLVLSGHFLARHIWVQRRNGAPEARGRFLDKLNAAAQAP